MYINYIICVLCICNYYLRRIFKRKMFEKKSYNSSSNSITVLSYLLHYLLLSFTHNLFKQVLHRIIVKQ